MTTIAPGPARSPRTAAPDRHRPDHLSQPTDRQASRPEPDDLASPDHGPADPPTTEGVTIVVFSGDFDRVQAAFNIAVGAASSGLPVTMFFTFWGLDVLTRPDARRLRHDPLQLAFRWLKPGGASRLPLSRFNFLGLGPILMRRLMGRFRMPTVTEMLELGHGLGVRYVACTITMGVMGLTTDDLVPAVDSYAGVATYLADASRARVNLFI